MKCKYCSRQISNPKLEVCFVCARFERDLQKYAEEQGEFKIVHDNNWAVLRVMADYDGIRIYD